MAVWRRRGNSWCGDGLVLRVSRRSVYGMPWTLDGHVKVFCLFLQRSDSSVSVSANRLRNSRIFSIEFGPMINRLTSRSLQSDLSSHSMVLFFQGLIVVSFMRSTMFQKHGIRNSSRGKAVTMSFPPKHLTKNVALVHQPIMEGK